MNSGLGKKWFMLNRFLRDYRKPLTYEIQETSRMQNPKLEEYYLLFLEADMQKQKGGSKTFEFDEHGIPVVPSYIDVVEKGFHYYPITIGQYALAVFHTYLSTESKKDLDRFLNLANWFYENRIEGDKRGFYWLTNTKKPEYGVNRPWVSAFSQSRSISVLLRAFQLTGKEDYRDCAINALTIYDIPNSEGGVKALHNGNVLYEEYTADFNVMVLDGAFFSMLGLFDLQRVIPENDYVKKLIKQGIDGLVALLPEYDLGYWIRYSLTDSPNYPQDDPATRGYFYLTLTLLKAFHYLTGRTEFEDYCKKYSEYDTFWNISKMYRTKYRALKKLDRV
ncbi:MAG: hypothetical protein HN986_06715 [Candidatus Marinimicrobia bacterium]|jgi:hypothetical protein|nr:hypothetical protein [Candidatus Neomarinimicrobiota bacterium]MBT6930505.1 hypothetical protein [Candidatus Neomarinimicrobiota bacterium]